MINLNRRQSFSRNVLIFLLFFLLALVLTYPLMFVPLNRYIPVYTIDPLLNVYILGWDIHRFLTLHFVGFFNANIFYPYKLTLAYSANLISTAALFALPVYLATKNFIVSYNMALLSDFI